ncbi:MAG: glucoamylase family protein, partial [Verrucomicrobiota bacterium]
MQPFSLRWQSWMARQSRPRLRVSEPPLRDELFSAEQLARHGRALAEGHQLATRRSGNSLLAQLDENEEVLRAFNHTTRAINPSRHITSAAEWLLDNFYLIEEQIQTARRHLPRGYSRELPRLLNGPSAGLPRVYDIVLELIAHVDAQIDVGSLSAFIASYQSVTSLKLGELWAVPIMLRLGLIENLQRITTRLRIDHEDRDLADMWVERLQDMAENDPAQLIVVVADMAKSNISLTSAFVAEFCQLLSRHSPVMHLARSWIEHRLLEQGLSIERLVDLESQSQAANQVSVSHSIASLRFLSATDWKEFVETLSGVEAMLRTDPSDAYAAMDFATRDRYRHAVEAIARHSQCAEAEVAQMAVTLAGDAARHLGRDDRTAHVGYYLVDKGQDVLGKRAGVRWAWGTCLGRGVQHFPLTLYVGGIGLLSLLAACGFMQQSLAFEVHGPIRGVLTLVFLLCASQLAVALMNWLCTLLVSPRLLPRLDYSAGIAPESRTMVVVPTMLTSEAGVERLIEKLEIHYLANRDEHLHFALLTDFRDAAAENVPADQALLQQARAGVEMLNGKYVTAGQDLFFLFHRPRRWNADDGLWMGYERKRGKLAEFNELLRGGASACFAEIVGADTILPMIKYVITLDTDTQLPRDAARRLVGTMSHPLNRPVFDAVRGVVTEGYGILQPRVGVSLPSSRRSWFVRLFASDAGVDPYTRAVSDVYQDLFQEGSFIGKGIYDVDAFQRAMDGRFPENTILSHDLLEACHARSALISDVEFYEDYPSRYDVDMDRRHRWMRGDWQITQWLMPRVPGLESGYTANPLSMLSRWKILDNLRRSLIPIGLMLFLLGLWLLAPQLIGLGLGWVLVIIILPGLLSSLVNGLRKPVTLPWSMHLREVGGSCGRQLGQAFLTFALLPYDAYISLDAIGRTLLRVLVTRRRLLEWQTSSDSEQTHRADLRGFYATMWIAPLVALVSGVMFALMQPGHLMLVLPLLSAWLAAPGIAWWISQPIQAATVELTPAQLEFLRSTTRKTWSYFETLVNAGENWLPPDNFQETPAPAVASRTSPTNMGLALLANLAARDFGYLPVGGLLQRTHDALATMHGLERHCGHFYNWYDTRTLDPLLPLYVSSVDSGNLAGHLLTLGSGLREEPETTIFSVEVFAGLRDTVEQVRDFGRDSATLTRLDAELQVAPSGMRTAHAVLAKATATTAALAATLAGEESAFQDWVQRLQQNCEAQLADLLWLAPWLALPSPAESSAAAAKYEAILARLDQAPTLREIAQFEQTICPMVEAEMRNLPSGETPEAGVSFTGLLRCLREAGAHARERLQTLETLALQCDEMAAMDFAYLFDFERDLFAIGFNVTERRRDNSFYDLLASEARLCSYVAIALGQVPQDHWFSMGRLLVAARGAPILASWSGSMFEYLMPNLVMPSYENTLLDHTCKAAVRQQIKYGKSRGVPWGISESGYNRIDVQFNYQYRAFGVPGLGLQRGLGEDLVIAPYATAMALIIDPVAACENLQRLAADDRLGSFGFYEAVDYTASRMPPEQTSVTIRSFMAHHQGMSLLALVQLLRGSPMQRRFMACPILKAADLLLQERVPKTAASVIADDLTPEMARTQDEEGESVMRVFTNPNSPVPEVHLLSNGRYHVVISSAGGGYSRWHDLALTRWHEDATRDHWGTFIYVRDLANGEVLSSAYQPTLRATDGYEAIFTQARAEFRQVHSGLKIHTQISVSPEDDVELRRITFTNLTSEARVIEVTSYAEVVLAKSAEDEAHPAFSNLFVQTEFAASSSAVLCTRRARSAEEIPPWLLHLMVGQDSELGEISCETERGKFIGRGGSLANPAAMQHMEPLSNTVGPVLDPIISLRRTVTVPPHASASIDLVLGVTDTRQTALTHVEKYQSTRMADRAFDMAWTHSQVTLHHLNVPKTEIQLYDRLAGALIYADPARRANPSVLLGNRRGHNGLWSHGISGDAPILLVHISDVAKIDIVRQVIQAHAYWRMKGLTVDLVILYEDVSVYRQSLLEQITSMLSSGIDTQILDNAGGIFIRRLEQISNEDRMLLQAAARVVLDDERGSLAEQLERRREVRPRVPALVPVSARMAEVPPPLPHRELLFSNGVGGFTRDGHEYIITLEHGQTTPAPWVNVLANPDFGTLISESGAAYTWLDNAHEFRVT